MRHAPVLFTAALLAIAQGISIAHAGMSVDERRDDVGADLCWDTGGLHQARPDGTCHDEDRKPVARPPADTFITKEAAAKLLKMFPQMRLVCPEGYELLTKSTGSSTCGKDLVEPFQSTTTEEKDSNPNDANSPKDWLP